MKHEWTDILRKKMTEHQMEPIHINWSTVDKAADKKAAARKSGIIMWGRLPAAALLLLAIGIASTFYLNKYGMGEDTPTSETNAHTHEMLAEHSHSHIKETEKVGTPKANNILYGSNDNSNIHQTKNGYHREIIDDSTEKRTEIPDNKTFADMKEEQMYTDAYSKGENYLASLTSQDLRKYGKQGRTGNKLSVSLSASQNMEAQTSSVGVLPVAGLFGEAPDNLISNGTTQLAGTESAPKSETNHHKPIRITLACSYPITRQLSISGGISYSYLNSEITDNAANYISYSKQDLHYLGIPLSVRYRLFKVGALGMYVGIGGMAEKLVKGSKSTDITRGREKEHKTASISSHSLQWSTNASLGIEVNLSQSVSLFGEAGASHYFETSSSISSYYTDKPNSMLFNFGLRYELP